MTTEIDKIPFLAKFTHEFRSHLHGICGISDYLKSNWENIADADKKNAIESVASISDDLSSLISLVSQYHEGATKLNFNIEKKDVISYTRKIIDNLIHLYSYKNKIEIIVESNVESLELNIDTVWFKQLVTNIVTNAIKYSTEGVVNIKIDADIKGEKCIFTVSDDGMGIKDEEIKSIFVPFKRGTNEAKKVAGTGLGLSICKEVVDAHQGTIRAYNNEDKGCSFEFILPIK